jgi:hypothetical protein
MPLELLSAFCSCRATVGEGCCAVEVPLSVLSIRSSRLRCACPDPLLDQENQKEKRAGTSMRRRHVARNMATLWDGKLRHALGDPPWGYSNLREIECRTLLPPTHL